VSFEDKASSALAMVAFLVLSLPHSCPKKVKLDEVDEGYKYAVFVYGAYHYICASSLF
jgi:hypothetical protein